MVDEADDDPDVRCIESRIVYENPWTQLTEDVVERRDGTQGLYAVMRSRDFALVIPWDGERFHLVEQFRYPVGARLWEFPQGSVGPDRAVTSRDMAEIELREEAGLTATTWQHLGFLHAGYGRGSNGFDVFLAESLMEVPPEREHEEQDMRAGAFTLDEVWSLVTQGRLTDSHSLAALALLQRWRQASGSTAAP